MKTRKINNDKKKKNQSDDNIFKLGKINGNDPTLLSMDKQYITIFLFILNV